jgi:hypothetical protein
MAAATAAIGGAAGAVEASIISGTGPTLSLPAFFSGGSVSAKIGDSLLSNAFFGSMRQFGGGGQGARLGGVQAKGDQGAALHRYLLDVGVAVGSPMDFGKNSMINYSSGPVGGPLVANGSFGDIVIEESGSVRGFVAFRLVDGLDSYYGYFDVEWSRTGTDVGSILSLNIHSWAYNSVAGQSITTGASAVPGGTGLAALAVGAAGLRGRRRSRN